MHERRRLLGQHFGHSIVAANDACQHCCQVRRVLPHRTKRSIRPLAQVVGIEAEQEVTG